MPTITIQEDATVADIVAKLNKPSEYVRRVLERMWECKRPHGSALVRIGVTGEGRAPNYRIEYPDDRSGVPQVFAVYNGLSHNPIDDLGELKIDLEALFKGGSPADAAIDRPDRLLRGDHWSNCAMTIDEVSGLLGQLRARKR